MQKSKNTVLIILALIAIFIYSCNKSDKDTTQTDKQKTDQTQNKNKPDTTKLVKDGKYVCQMHPLMQANEPMKCPICRMNMVSKVDFNKQLSEEHESMESKFAGKMMQYILK